MLPEPSKIILTARKLLQLNQEDFAERIGKTQGVLSRYENGKVKPPSEIVMHCMHILNEDSFSADIEQIINKVRSLDGEQHAKVREAISLILDKCIYNSLQ